MAEFLDLSNISKLIFGLPHAQPGGLVLTWLLFLSTIAFSIPLSYILACVARQMPAIGQVVSPIFTVLRGIPPLVVIFVIDHFFPLEIFQKGALALIIYSMSHLFPILYKYICLYPKELIWVESVHNISPLRCYAWLWAPWVFDKSFPAIHTHMVSLFKDTSIVILIGMLELSAVTTLLSSRAYQFYDWIEIFFLCSILYFLNVQVVSLLSLKIRSLISLSRSDRGALLVN